MNRPQKKSGLANAGRRMFLYRAGGLGVGAAAGEGLFRWFSHSTTSGVRTAERATRELFLDFSMAAGQLENQIGVERDRLELELDRHLKIIGELNLPDLIDTNDVEELLENLDYIHTRYKLAERMRQLGDRLETRLIQLDSQLESMQPELLQRFGDFIRGMHGKPSGEDYRALRDSLVEKVTLLSKAYATAEDTRRVERAMASEVAGLLTELNDMLEDPELEDIADEVRRLISRSQIESPQGGNGNQLSERNLQRRPALSQEQLKRAQSVVEEIRASALRIRSVMIVSKDVQKSLSEGELLIQELRSRKGADGKRATNSRKLRRRLEVLEQRVRNELSRLENIGITVPTRQQEVEQDSMTEGLEQSLEGDLFAPFRWASIAIFGGLGYLFGARISRARSRVQKQKEDKA